MMKQATLVILLVVGAIVLQVGCRTSASCHDDYAVQSKPVRMFVADADSRPTSMCVTDMDFSAGSILAVDVDSCPGYIHIVDADVDTDTIPPVLPAPPIVDSQQ